MLNKENIISTLESFLEERSQFVADLTIGGDNQINVVLDGDQRVTIDDCAEVTRYLETQYDREEEDYELNVSTFGINNPVKHVHQLNKIVGRDILLGKPEGKEYHARLDAVHGNTLEVTYQVKKGGPKQKALIFKDGEKETLSFDDLSYVKEFIRF